MKPVLYFLCALAVSAQSSEVKEIRFQFDPEPRVRPGETISVQLQVWGDAIARDGTRTPGRLRETANPRVADGQGWISKPYRFQGTDSAGYVNTAASGFASIFQNVSGQYLIKDAVLYTAPEQPGTYTIEGEAKGVKGSAQITVANDVPTRRPVESVSFPGVIDTNRFRKLAEHWAPFLAQETWWQPKADIPTRFDFDGDWDGGNNWDRLDSGTSQAYVHYAVVETGTHWFLHYNFFHPRDYSDNCVVGTCHENDNEGIILTVRKGSGDFGTLELMETLAHNNVYSFSADRRLKKGAHDIDAEIQFHDGHHPIVFIEAGGHGALGSGARASTYSASRNDFVSGTGMTFLYKGVAERAKHGNDRNIGYDLIPIETAWWARAQSGEGNTFDAAYDYEPYGNRPGSGRRYLGSFLGRKFGANKAKPFWGWHDERTRRGKVLNTGQWALDPAYAVSRNVTWPGNLPVDLNYIYNPYLGVGDAAAPPPTSTPALPGPIAEATEGTCQIEATIDGAVEVRLNGDRAAYQVLSGQPERDTSIGCNGAIPQRSLSEFDVRKSKGRGSVKLLEPPNAANGYTAKIQIDDPSRGANAYVVVVRWKL